MSEEDLIEIFRSSQEEEQYRYKCTFAGCIHYNKYTTICEGHSNCEAYKCPHCQTILVEDEEQLCSVCASEQYCSMCGYNMPHINEVKSIPLYEIDIIKSAPILSNARLMTKIICGECLMGLKICVKCQNYTDNVTILKGLEVCDKCAVKYMEKEMDYCYYCQKLYKKSELIGGVCPDCI